MTDYPKFFISNPETFPGPFDYYYWVVKSETDVIMMRGDKVIIMESTFDLSTFKDTLSFKEVIKEELALML